MSSPTLDDAAYQSYANMATLSAANTLKTQLAAFCTTALAIFPNETPSNHPCANWLVLLSALAEQMPATNVPFTSLVVSADYMWRLCMLAFTLKAQGFITTAQGVALLAAYNADIA